MNITDRFLKYVSFCTTSDEETNMTPSTPGQMEFAEYLKNELQNIGMQDVTLDKNGYLMATLPATVDGKPTIGFIAHMDTSPDASGKHVQPRIVKNYNGEDILLNEEEVIVLETSKYPEILRYKGQDIIVTNGKTLLGADDKAGIAEIVSACEYLIQHPEIKHGKIRVGFTPDEEIGQGADHFDVAKFGCDFAYTMDGGAIGELEFENFNAASCKIHVHGVNVHPGYGYHKMLNSMRIAYQLAVMLPRWETPEHTQGYEGFYHLEGVSATVDHATARYIVRDHDAAKFQQKLELIDSAAALLNQRLGEERVTVEIKQQYRNMAEIVCDYPELIDVAKEAYLACGVEPQVLPIRGGTDGAQLSFRGLPCPNLSTGGYCYHGVNEFVPVSSLVKMTDVLQELVARFA